MLGRDLRHSLDPVLFAGERLGLELDPVQARLLRVHPHRSLVNCSRQWGKSTVTATGALHEGTFVFASKTIILSPSQRQSSLLLAKVEELAELAKVAAKPLGGEDPGLRLPAGVVIALPGQEATTRGFDRCTWLVIDEAARVPDSLWFAARAYLATTNGRMSLLSTPFGKRGFFFHEHESGRWDVTRVPATECPRISAEFLAEQRESMPDSWFRQEYMCEFTSVEDGVFDHDLVLQSLSSEVEPLWL
jgi:hypothetical protein